MNHTDHVRLLQNGIPARGGVWADLGAGRGAFTLALADLIQPGCTIYAVDRDGRALNANRQTVESRFPSVTLHTLQADFTRSLNLPPLDGVVMANSLHFVKNKGPVLKNLRDLLKDDGRLLVIEYDTDRGNRWVPYPFSYPTWRKLATAAGFSHTERIAIRQSSFLGQFYAAMSLKQKTGG